MALAQAAKEALNLDEVIWIPAFQNPLKTRKSTSAKQRLEMVKLAVEGVEGMAVSDSEIQRRGQSYAIDTVSELQYLNPAEYWFIVGADSLKTLPQWKQPERLLRLCRIAAAVRGKANPQDVLKFLPEPLRSGIDFIPMDTVEASSTAVRELVYRGRPIDRYVSKAVIKYVQENKLYKI
jgi:nicotinate-nucleotide adenylyltransferase